MDARSRKRNLGIRLWQPGHCNVLLEEQRAPDYMVKSHKVTYCEMQDNFSFPEVGSIPITSVY